MDEQEAREARHEQAWERYMEAERKDLRMRAEGHLARILGHALPDEAPEELARRAEEDQLRASEGLVELMDEHGEITHRLIDELTPQNRSARIRAEGARVEWIADRRARRSPLPPGPGPIGQAGEEETGHT